MACAALPTTPINCTARSLTVTQSAVPSSHTSLAIRCLTSATISGSGRAFASSMDTTFSTAFTPGTVEATSANRFLCCHKTAESDNVTLASLTVALTAQGLVAESCSGTPPNPFGALS